MNCLFVSLGTCVNTNTVVGFNLDTIPPHIYVFPPLGNTPINTVFLRSFVVVT